MVNKHLVFCHLLQSSILVSEPHGKQLLEKTSRWRKHPLRVFLPVTSHDTIGWSILVHQCLVGGNIEWVQGRSRLSAKRTDMARRGRNDPYVRVTWLPRLQVAEDSCHAIVSRLLDSILFAATTH